jgi:hypothetical protein
MRSQLQSMAPAAEPAPAEQVIISQGPAVGALSSGKVFLFGRLGASSYLIESMPASAEHLWTLGECRLGRAPSAEASDVVGQFRQIAVPNRHFVHRRPYDHFLRVS